MSFHPGQFRDQVRRVLRYLEPDIPYSEKAVELLMLTAAQETCMGKYLVQVKGPAHGVFQMEPATEKGLLESLNKKANLKEKIQLLSYPALTETNGILNLAYQIAMARIYYFFKPGPIPETTADRAIYYKKYWNTMLGKATAAEAIVAYNRYCGEVVA